MTTPVSFEIAKLLKEKGYRILPDFKSSYPTIAEVVMWLYEKYGIWVQGPFPLNNGKWEWVVFFLKEPLDGSDGFKNRMSILDEKPYYNTPTEAYEAAIEYVLKNLIQEEEQETKVVNLRDKERQRIYEKILNRKME